MPPLKGNYKPVIDNYETCGLPDSMMGEMECTPKPECFQAGGRCRMFRVPDGAADNTPWEIIEPTPPATKVQRESGYRYRCFCVKIVLPGE